MNSIETMGFDVRLGKVRIQYDDQDGGTLYICNAEVESGMSLKYIRHLMDEIRNDLNSMSCEFAYSTGAVKLSDLRLEEEYQESVKPDEKEEKEEKESNDSGRSESDSPAE